MNTNDVLALAPGPALDEAVHRHVYGESGHEPAPAFSTDFAAGALLLDRLPLFVARVEKPKDPAKPWIAGTIAPDMEATSWRTTLTVSGPTMLGVLCRAALLVALKSPPIVAAEPKSGPVVVKPAAAMMTRRGDPAGARLLPNRKANGSKVPVKAPDRAPVPAKATQRPIPAIRQPSIFLGARSKLAPLPKRKPFLMPGDPTK